MSVETVPHCWSWQHWVESWTRIQCSHLCFGPTPIQCKQPPSQRLLAALSPHCASTASFQAFGADQHHQCMEKGNQTRPMSDWLESLENRKAHQLLFDRSCHQGLLEANLTQRYPLVVINHWLDPHWVSYSNEYTEEIWVSQLWTSMYHLQYNMRWNTISTMQRSHPANSIWSDKQHTLLFECLHDLSKTSVARSEAVRYHKQNRDSNFESKW